MLFCCNMSLKKIKITNLCKSPKIVDRMLPKFLLVQNNSLLAKQPRKCMISFKIVLPEKLIFIISKAYFETQTANLLSFIFFVSYQKCCNVTVILPLRVILYCGNITALRHQLSALPMRAVSVQSFVLTVTIFREAVDDIRRHQRDKEVNSQKYCRLAKGKETAELVPSSKLRVGDLVRSQHSAMVLILSSLFFEISLVSYWCPYYYRYGVIRVIRDVPPFGRDAGW